jgi:4-hydroxy 2-oxovalerate aldolase
VNSILELNRLLGVNLVEIGFLMPNRDPNFGPFSQVSEKLAGLFHQPDLNLGFMVEAKAAESFSSVDDFLKFSFSRTSGFSFVRLAATIRDQELASRFANAALEKGLQVHINVMRASELVDIEVSSFFETMPPECSGFYLADSFGSLVPEETFKLVSAIAQTSGTTIGFHAHNNRSLALANVRAAVEAGATLIDGTWAGHGRGSGNARLEELITEFEPSALDEAGVYALGTHLEAHEYDEGKVRDESSFAYHFGAYRGVHPNVVSALLAEDRGLSLGEILLVLAGNDDSHNSEVPADSLLRQESAPLNLPTPRVIPEVEGKVCLLVGNAPGIPNELMEVELARGLSNVKVCALNGKVNGLESTPDVVFMLHRFRAKQLLDDFRHQQPLVVSPIEAPLDYRAEWLTVPYELNKDFDLTSEVVALPSPTSLSYALACLAKSGASEVILVGIGNGLDKDRLEEEERLLQKFMLNAPQIRVSRLGNARYPLPLGDPWA